MEARDIYLKTTQKDSGKKVITEHRVWNADKFIEARQADAKKEETFTVSVSTREEYQKQKH